MPLRLDPVYLLFRFSLPLLLSSRPLLLVCVCLLRSLSARCLLCWATRRPNPSTCAPLVGVTGRCSWFDGLMRRVPRAPGRPMADVRTVAPPRCTVVGGAQRWHFMPSIFNALRPLQSVRLHRSRFFPADVAEPGRLEKQRLSSLIRRAPWRSAEASSHHCRINPCLRVFTFFFIFRFIAAGTGTSASAPLHQNFDTVRRICTHPSIN